ncbi:MAG: hypothetical protein LBP90_01750, partial [Burkholderiales bacterium]|nr:hypothetical protein [Burkholderiales bacterium]
MKGLSRVLVIAALAVAVGIFARANSGYVQMAMPQMFSLETSMNFFIIILFIVFVIFYMLLRGALALWHFSHHQRQRSLQKRQTRLLQKQNEALLALWREDPNTAQKAMTGLTEAPDASGVSVLLAAQAALRSKDDKTVKRLLQHPSLSEAKYEVPRTLIEAEWLLWQQRAADALPLWSELRSKTG